MSLKLRREPCGRCEEANVELEVELELTRALGARKTRLRRSS